MKEIDKSIMVLYKAYLTNRQNKKYIVDTTSLRKGILINDKCSNKIKKLAIDIWGKDGFLLNQTFHKSLKTVIDSDIESLFINQIIHYITTYGYESIGIYNKDTVFIPNEKLEIPDIKDDIELINITAITKEELKEKLLSLITSSIPLSKQTIECISNLTDYLDINKDNIDIIKNKELKNVFYDKLGIIPKDNIEFIRYFIYKLTNNTLLIKDKETIELLKVSDKNTALKLLKKYKDSYGLIPLAEIFNRYKPFFLSLKTKESIIKKKNKELNKIINKISKLSKKYHKPFISNDLDNFIEWYEINNNKSNFIDLLNEKLEKENIWRIIKLRNYINLNNSGITSRVYKIRNGRTWITSKYSSVKVKKEVLDILDNIIINKLKSNIDGKKVYLDSNIDLIIPSSEKQFVGNIPFSSMIKIDKDDLLVGIHWLNVEDNRVDLDLKIISNDYSIGWDARYKKDDMLVFTGDMTDAPFPNGASEYIYINKLIDNTTFSLKVNNYTSNVDNIEYDLIIAKKNKDKIIKNYIVDPSDIIIKIPNNKIELGKSENSLGNIIVDGNTIKVILSNLSTSNKKTSANNSLESIVRSYLKEENIFKCKLKDFIIKSGGIITNNRNDADIDLSINQLNKDSIINLFK